MTRSEYLNKLTQAVNDALQLPDDIVIADVAWWSEGLRLLIAHDTDMERCESLGEHCWQKTHVGPFDWLHSITMEGCTTLVTYEEDLPPTTEPAHTCKRCGKTIYQYYEGIPNRNAKPGVYCLTCWESLAESE